MKLYELYESFLYLYNYGPVFVPFIGRNLVWISICWCLGSLLYTQQNKAELLKSYFDERVTRHNFTSVQFRLACRERERSRGSCRQCMTDEFPAKFSIPPKNFTKWRKPAHKNFWRSNERNHRFSDTARTNYQRLFWYFNSTFSNTCFFSVFLSHQLGKRLRPVNEVFREWYHDPQYLYSGKGEMKDNNTQNVVTFEWTFFSERFLHVVINVYSSRIPTNN